MDKMNVLSIVALVVVVFGSALLFGFSGESVITGAAIGTHGDIATGSSCGNVNHSLTLTANITTALAGDITNSASICFNITNSSVVIDGAGFALINTNNTGFAIASAGGFDNITIKNFRDIRNFSTGILSQGPGEDDWTIYNNTITFNESNQQNGIQITSGSGTNISNNTITMHTSSSSTGYAIDLQSSVSNAKIHGNLLVSSPKTEGTSVGTLTKDASTHTIWSNNNFSTYGRGGVGLDIAGTNTTLRENAFHTRNADALRISGVSGQDGHSIHTTNTEHNEPIYYYKNNNSVVIDHNASIGQLFIYNAKFVYLENVSFNRDGATITNASNVTVTKSTFNITDTLGTALNIAGVNQGDVSGKNITISHNVFNVSGGAASTLSVDINDSTILNNTMHSNSDGTMLPIGARGTQFINNLVNWTGQNGGALSVRNNNSYIANNQFYGSSNNQVEHIILGGDSGGGTSVAFTTVVNNTFVVPGKNAIRDLSNADIVNYLIYNTTFVDLRFINNASDGYPKNITALGALGHGGNITMGNNTYSFISHDWSDNLQPNASANITFTGLDLSEVKYMYIAPAKHTTRNAIKGNGSICTSCQNISYANGKLIFNVTHASASYTAVEEAAIPTLTDTSVSVASVLQNGTVTLTAHVDDDVEVSEVRFNLQPFGNVTATLSGRTATVTCNSANTCNTKNTSTINWTHVWINDTANKIMTNTSIGLSYEINTTPIIGLALVTPAADMQFGANETQKFVVNVSCSAADCSVINVSLDPFAGCNPGGSDCSAACNGLFTSHSTTWSSGSGICTGVNDSATILNDAVSDANMIAGSANGNAAVYDPEEDSYVCISYERNNNVSVTVGAGTCFCVDEGDGCGIALTDIFDLTSAFFAGPAGASTSKSGLVSNTANATPFYTNTTNPYTVNLSNGQSELVTWWVNATGNTNTFHTFFAYANKSGTPSIGARTGNLNITLGVSGGFESCFANTGNSAACTAAGCTYDPFTTNCFPNINNFDCDTFCDLCTTETACGVSDKACSWNSTLNFCHEDFDNFDYGMGGTQVGNDFFNAIPPDCINNPTQCDSAFDAVYNFVKAESICFDGVDNDADAKTDCADSDCFFFPECSGTYNRSADSTPPQIKNSVITPDVDSSVITFVTGEPTNATILFYNLNTTCNGTINKTIVEEDDPFSTFDDYKLDHFLFIDNVSLGHELVASTTYFYKTNATDQAANKYLSACLNFTTASARKEFKLNFTGTHANFMQFDFGSGFEDYNASSGITKNRTKNAVLRFTNAGVPLKFGGVNIAAANSFDFNNAFTTGASSAFGSKSYFRMNSTVWQQMVQQLGVKNFTMTMPARNCNVVSRCNDNASVCTDVSTRAKCTVYNTSHVNVTIDAKLGFSSYVAGSSSQLNISDDTDTTSKTPATTVNFFANYTNVTSGIHIHNDTSDANCKVTIATLSVTETNMTFNASGDNRWRYQTSSFGAAGSFDWSANCSATKFDTLNVTDTVTITAAAAEEEAAAATASSGSGSAPLTEPTAIPPPDETDEATDDSDVSSGTTDSTEQTAESAGDAETGGQAIAGHAFFTDIGEYLNDYSTIYLSVLAVLILLIVVVYFGKKVHLWERAADGVGNSFMQHWKKLIILLVIVAFAVVIYILRIQLWQGMQVVWGAISGVGLFLVPISVGVVGILVLMYFLKKK